METYLDDIFASHKVAMGLRDIGFDEPCIGMYQRVWDGVECEYVNKIEFLPNQKIHEGGVVLESVLWVEAEQCLAPTWEQIAKWFREVYGYEYKINSNVDGYTYMLEVSYGNENAFKRKHKVDDKEISDFWIQYMNDMTDVDIRKTKLRDHYDTAREEAILDLISRVKVLIDQL